MFPFFVLQPKPLTAKSFSKSVLFLSASSALAQLISIGLSPVLTRLYSPSEFGLFTLFISITSMVAVAASGRFEMAFMHPEQTSEVRRLFHSALTWLLVSVIVVTTGTALWVHFDSGSSLSFIWYLIPIGAAAVGLANMNNMLATRFQKFNLIGISNVCRSVINNGLSLLLGYLEIGIGLIVGYLFGQAGFWVASKIGTPKLDEAKYSIESVKNTVAKYREFPLVNGPSALANIASNQLPIIILAIAFNDATIGLYGLIMKVLNAPLIFIGKAVSQVFFGQVSESVRDGSFDRRKILRIGGLLTLFITLLLLPLLFFGESIFGFVFGQEWTEAGKIVAIFIPFYIVRFVYYCLSTLMIIKKKLKVELYQNIFAFSAQFIAVSFGCFYLESSYGAFQLIATAGFISYVIFVVQLYRIIR